LRPALLEAARGRHGTFSPQQECDQWGGLWFDYRDLAASPATWTSREGLAHVLTLSGSPSLGATGLTFNGSTGVGLRTNSSANKIKFLRSTVLPDGIGMTSGATGKGVTGCGLTWRGGENFSIGTHGDTNASRDGTGPYQPTIMRVTYDGVTITKVNEVDLSLLISGIKSVQGIGYDTSDSSHWIASATGAGTLKVYNIASNDTLASGKTITPTWAPNGIALVPGGDKIWIAEEPSVGGNIESRKLSDGTVVNAAVSSAVSNQDIMQYHSGTGALLLTYGANASTDNTRLFATSGASGALAVVGDAVLPSQVDCVEGVYWDGGPRYVYLVDAHYHSGTLALNSICECRGVPAMANFVSIHLTAELTGATTGTDCLVELGGGTDGPNDGFGVGIYPASTTTMTISVNTAASGTTQRGIISAASVSNMSTAFRMIDIFVDMTNDLLYLYIDGAQVGSATSISATVGGLSLWGSLRVAGGASGRQCACIIKDVIIIGGCNPDAISRQERIDKMVGFRAHEHQLQSQLAGTHPYRYRRP
jgi:hypothetical protein